MVSFEPYRGTSAYCMDCIGATRLGLFTGVLSADDPLTNFLEKRDDIPVYEPPCCLPYMILLFYRSQIHLQQNRS